MTEQVQDTAATLTDTATTDAAAPAEAEGTLATASADTAAQAADNPAQQDAAAPVEYEPFAMPEGITADEEVLGEFKAAAQELKLSQKDAQKFADMAAKLQLKQAENYRKAQEGWIEAAKTDKEFGGEALQSNLGMAKKAMATFATPELVKVLEATGLGNHPELIRAFYRVGKAISEDNRVVTGQRAGVPSDPAKRLFPNQV